MMRTVHLTRVDMPFIFSFSRLLPVAVVAVVVVIVRCYLGVIALGIERKRVRFSAKMLIKG